MLPYPPYSNNPANSNSQNHSPAAPGNTPLPKPIPAPSAPKLNIPPKPQDSQADQNTAFMGNPTVKAFKNNILKSIAENDGICKYSVRALYKDLGLAVPNNQNLSRDQLEDWCDLLGKLGFIFAPYYPIHGVALTLDDNIYIARAAFVPAPTRPLAVMSVVLRLGALVAQIDGGVAPSEEEALKRIIAERTILTESEQISLQLWLRWCIETPQKISDIENRISCLPPQVDEHLSHILITIACADGRIDPSEVLTIRKLYKKLGLPEDRVGEDIRVCLRSTAQVLPKPAPIRPLTSINLSNGITSDFDPDVIPEDYEEEEEVPRETAIDISFELGSALASICTDSEGSNLTDIFERNPFATSQHSASQQSTSRAGLHFDFDQAHLDLIQTLSETEEWDRIDFFVQAAKHRIMADRFIQKINAWAIAHDVAPLIKDGDMTVTIDKNRMQAYL